MTHQKILILKEWRKVVCHNVKAKKLPWLCTDVEGVSNGVSPAACTALADQGEAATPCPFREDRLPMDDVEFKECSYTRSTL